ncbi:MAG: DNA repair protein RecN, partial [Clostridia bacterium]|nr:DNA repair protein RecN [Clostridia bacterium]
DIDSRELERAEARLDEYKSIKKKYGATLTEIQTFYEKASAEYTLLSESEERLAILSDELKKVNGEIYECCKRLSQFRKNAAEGFTHRVCEELKTLNIGSASFEIRFGDFSIEDVGSAGGNGLDQICFLFSANAGEPPKELGKIISGGEMSRFMLAVKAQLSSVGSIGTYLFDEIDAGIGGKTARVMGEKFLKIAKNIQIIAVTHSAQIASFADRQFLIEKREENDSTRTYLREVKEGDRVKEIARLIGGNESELSLKHAEEMLKNAITYKNSL